MMKLSFLNSHNGFGTTLLLLMAVTPVRNSGGRMG
jgi:hypothetical protein